MLKVLQINTEMGSGSTGRIACQINELAEMKGWETYSASNRGIGINPSHHIKIGNSIDTLYHTFYSILLDKHGLASTRSTKKFLKILEEIKPDIIHLHNIHGFYLNYPILFTWLKNWNKPVVWTLHDCWPFTGHCSHYACANCNKWRTGCFNCPLKKDYPTSLLLDHSKENYQYKKKYFLSLQKLTLVPVSSWLKKDLEASFFSNIPIKLIRNGIDVNDFYPMNCTSQIKGKFGLTTSKKILLGVASFWNKRKGLFDYIKLSNLLPKEYQIILVGLRPKQIKKLPKNIIGLERTKNINELAALYSAAEIVMNLSYQETFGLTTIEGFACGTPSIVYNCTASPELVTKETGLIVEPGDIKSTIDAIKTITNNGKKFYSKSCIARTHTHFDQTNNFLQYIDLYNKLVKEDNFK